MEWWGDICSSLNYTAITTPLPIPLPIQPIQSSSIQTGVLAIIIKIEQKLQTTGRDLKSCCHISFAVF